MKVTLQDVEQVAKLARLEVSPAEKEAFAKQLVSVSPNPSLEEAQSWLNGEIANWQKITAEVKIEMN